MTNADPEFVRASIETQRTLLATELKSDFAQWGRLPSADMASSVAAWRSLGPTRAERANDQGVASYYWETGREALLPDALRSIRGREVFDEWRSLSIQSQMAGDIPFAHAPAGRKIRGNEAKENVEEVLRRSGIGFSSSAAPLFLTRSGSVIYLSILQRKHLLDAQLICSREEAPVPLAKHCGLHTIIRDCEAQTLTGSPDTVEIVASEIIRHVELMREKLM